jgi:hypothetical protein
LNHPLTYVPRDSLAEGEMPRAADAVLLALREHARISSRRHWPFHQQLCPNSELNGAGAERPTSNIQHRT